MTHVRVESRGKATLQGEELLICEKRTVPKTGRRKENLQGGLTAELSDDINALLSSV